MRYLSLSQAVERLQKLTGDPLDETALLLEVQAGRLPVCFEHAGIVHLLDSTGAHAASTRLHGILKCCGPVSLSAHVNAAGESAPRIAYEADRLALVEAFPAATPKPHRARQTPPPPAGARVSLAGPQIGPTLAVQYLPAACALFLADDLEALANNDQKPGQQKRIEYTSELCARVHALYEANNRNASAVFRLLQGDVLTNRNQVTEALRRHRDFSSKSKRPPKKTSRQTTDNALHAALHGAKKRP